MVSLTVHLFWFVLFIPRIWFVFLDRLHLERLIKLRFTVDPGFVVSEFIFYRTIIWLLAMLFLTMSSKISCCWLFLVCLALVLFLTWCSWLKSVRNLKTSISSKVFLTVSYAKSPKICNWLCWVQNLQVSIPGYVMFEFNQISGCEVLAMSCSESQFSRSRLCRFWLCCVQNFIFHRWLCPLPISTVKIILYFWLLKSTIKCLAVIQKYWRFKVLHLFRWVLAHLTEYYLIQSF